VRDWMEAREGRKGVALRSGPDFTMGVSGRSLHHASAGDWLHLRSVIPAASVSTEDRPLVRPGNGSQWRGILPHLLICPDAARCARLPRMSQISWACGPFHWDPSRQTLHELAEPTEVQQSYATSFVHCSF